MALDPRLANIELLALAALRVKQHRAAARAQAPDWPEPDEAWWAELWHLLHTSPWGGEVLAQLGLPAVGSPEHPMSL